VFGDAVLTPGHARRVAVERAWQQLIATGPTLTSTERRSVVTAARDAWSVANGASLNTASQPDSLIAAARAIAVDAEGITAEIVAGFEADGLDLFRYLEIVGIVARLSNIDWYMRGIGAAVPELASDSTAVEIPPTGRVDPQAAITDSWVPMTSAAMAPFVLDALPDEGVALRDLHEPMYVNMATIGD